MSLSEPELLTTGHRLGGFDCGQPDLDRWLSHRALQNQVSGASRTYVACQDERVVAYYALASGGVEISRAPGAFRRNMPNPIPVAILARLAIDRRFQGQGIGRALVRDAARRVARAADTIGIRGLVTHAVTEEAREFYLAIGFDPSPIDRMTLVIKLSDVAGL